MYWPMVRPPERREMVSEQVDDRQLSRWVTRAGAYPGWVPRLAGHEDPAVRWQVILAIVAFHRRRFVAYLRPTPSLAQAFRKWDRESAREGGSPLCE